MGCLCGSATHGVEGREQFWSVERHSNGRDVVLVIDDERYKSQVRLALTRADLGRLVACLERCLPRVAGKLSAEEEKKIDEAAKADRLRALEVGLNTLKHRIDCMEVGSGGPGAGGTIANILKRLDSHFQMFVDLVRVIEHFHGPDAICAGASSDGPLAAARTPPAPATPNTWPMSPREVCRRYAMQNCHCCERLACGDNTSPGAALYRAAKKCIGVPSGAALAAKADLIAAVGAVENMA